VIPALRSHASELFEARQLLLRIQPDWLLSMLRLLRRGCHRQGLGIGRASVYRVLEAGSLIVSAQPLLLR